MFSFNLRTKRHREILAVESNGYTLRAAFVCADGDEIRVRQVEESQKSDPYEALTEVVENLDRAKMPASAILLVPEASAAILELPVDPRAPRPAAEMQELVRWELESQVVRNIGTAPIGEILVGRGYLTYEQVDVVCEEIDHRIHTSGTAPDEDAAVMPSETELRKIPGSRSSPRYVHRFGETAVDLGLISHEALQECLEIQRRYLANADQELVCGWTAQPTSKTVESTLYRWLVCGIGRDLCYQWSEAFEALGLTLKSIYPLAGCSAAAVNAHSEGPSVVLEMQPGLVSATQLADGHIGDFQLESTEDRAPSAEMLETLIGFEKNETVWLSGRSPQLDDFLNELTSRYGNKVQTIPVQVDESFDQDVTAESLAGIAGAACHTLHLTDPDRVACILRQTSESPYRQKRWIGMAAAVLSMVMPIAASEIALAVGMANASRNKDQALEELKALQAAVGRRSTQTSLVEELTASKKKLENELATVGRQQKFFKVAVVNRARFLPDLLDVVSEAASEEAVVDRVDETQQQEIHVAGWATSEVAASRFAESLASALRKWHLVLKKPAVKEAKGRLGLDGYSIELYFTTD